MNNCALGVWLSAHDYRGVSACIMGYQRCNAILKWKFLTYWNEDESMGILNSKSFKLRSHYKEEVFNFLIHFSKSFPIRVASFPSY